MSIEAVDQIRRAVDTQAGMAATPTPAPPMPCRLPATPP